MKRLIATALCGLMLVGTLTACGGNDAGTPSTSGSSDEKVINVFSFTDEVPKMVTKYLEMHPELGYTMKETIIATTDGAYQPALDEALKAGGKDAPDIYMAEAAFVLKYCQGDAAGFAASYKDLGIDIDAALKASDTAKYAYEIGTRPSDNAVVGLPYQSTGGCFIYNRTVAKETWGSDDPETVQAKIGGGSGNWDKFWSAAEDLKAKGFGIISGDGDIWHAIENSSDKGWLVDGKLHIDPKREAFLDISKKLKDNDYHNDTTDWTEAWYADMAETGSKKVLGFFGPAWLINYTMAGNSGGSKPGEGTYGDWGVCNSPVGFSWGGTWVLANKDVPASKKEVVKDIISWITLDSDENSLQYMWANGTLNGEGGTKDTVCSGTVMSKSNGEIDFLGGQNMFDYFVPANQYAQGRNLTQYDETINSAWRDAVRNYAAGNTTREEAIENFKAKVKTDLGIDAE